MEEWQSVIGFDTYEVSVQGNVKGKRGILKPQSTNGYKTVYLYKNKKRIRLGIHRLVAGAFVPNPYQYTVVNHINEDKEDNSFTNLEWCTLSYNSLFSNPQLKPVRKKVLTLLYKQSDEISFEQIVCLLKDNSYNQAWIKGALKYFVEAGLISQEADYYKIMEQGKTIYTRMVDVLSKRHET